MLAAQTTLPMQLRILWWERGLKDDIRRMCSVDPLTHKDYSDIEKAQSAACACDAHLFSAAAVTTDLATHTDLCDANSDDGDKSGDELPVHKRPCLTTGMRSAGATSVDALVTLLLLALGKMRRKKMRQLQGTMLNSLWQMRALCLSKKVT